MTFAILFDLIQTTNCNGRSELVVRDTKGKIESLSELLVKLFVFYWHLICKVRSTIRIMSIPFTSSTAKRSCLFDV